MRMSLQCATNASAGSPDLELIAERILKLAEIATLEHLQSLAESQAAGVLKLAQEADAA